MKRFTILLIALYAVLGLSAQVISVSEALQIASALDSGEATDESYTIEGYVNVIQKNDFNTSYNNMEFWIADTRGSAGGNVMGALLVYRGRPDRELVVGDKVRVVSTLKNYNGTLETGIQNAPVTWLESAPIDPVPDPDTLRGNLRVCGQNLENYYFNLNTGRGNYTPEEFADKTRKIVNAILTIDADIYAFCELEANEIVLAQLVDSVNARVEGTPYTYVSDGISTTWSPNQDNNIKSGFVYRRDKVKTVGGSNSGSPGGYYSRTMRIQVFEHLASHEQFTLSMNHFKAKDSSSDAGESQRLSNANNLMSALNKYAYDPDILILGDLNCEVGEAPLNIIENAGYEEQILLYDPSAYSHCYGGGELIDHAYANSSMAEQIVNAYVVHISAYRCNASVPQSASYSDHDPYVVELALGEEMAVENVHAKTMVRKTIESGQLLLTLPDGSTYNVMGIRVR